MQLVTAVIKPHKVDEVKEALRAVGIQGITITEVKGFGRQGGHTERYRGAEYTIEFIPKMKLEIVVDEGDVPKVTDAILGAAADGQDRRRQDLGDSSSVHHPDSHRGARPRRHLRTYDEWRTGVAQRRPRLCVRTTTVCGRSGGSAP